MEVRFRCERDKGQDLIPIYRVSLVTTTGQRFLGYIRRRNGDGQYREGDGMWSVQPGHVELGISKLQWFATKKDAIVALFNATKGLLNEELTRLAQQNTSNLPTSVVSLANQTTVF